MSREDLRDEYKETEGSPQIRGRIRSLQRQMRRRRVKADVSRAAVVLTNPTHYAVALGFDFVTMEAPKVLAKGRNLLAEEIKAEARWAGVPIVENPAAGAIALPHRSRWARRFPCELYAAVAAILAYLYRQRVEAELRERRRAKLPPALAASGCRRPNGSRSERPHERCRVLEEAAMSTTACRQRSSGAIDLAPAARVRAAAGGDQRDLCDAGAAAGRRPGLSAGALDGRLGHRLSLRGADSPRRRAFGLSHAAAAADALPAVAEHRLQPAHSAARAGGNGARRAR